MTRARFERAWQRAEHAQTLDAVALWLRHGALPADEAWRRTAELVALARLPASADCGGDGGGELIGISTAVVGDCPLLDLPMYYLRVFVAPRHRNPAIARGLLAESVRALTPAGPAAEALHLPRGVWLEMQNPKIDRAIRDLVWRVREFDFTYIGRSPHGQVSRACYFPGARLPRPAQAR